MAIKSCILLFILCLSLHASHGRRLAVYEKKLAKKLHPSIRASERNDEKVSGVPKMKHKLSKEAGVPKEEGKKETSESPKLKDGRAKEQKMKTLSSSRMVESLDAVSWRVPHMKRGEKNPGFNLDYAPPKTHPPSHN
ncbi:hypothetical protein SLA2020_137500 [Shorea laevis]